MTDAVCGHAPALRPKPDLLTALCRRLDQHRRAAHRRGLIELERDLREAARFLRAFRLDDNDRCRDE
jgi:hypothetical protein